MRKGQTRRSRSALEAADGEGYAHSLLPSLPWNTKAQHGQLPGQYSPLPLVLVTYTAAKKHQARMAQGEKFTSFIP